MSVAKSNVAKSNVKKKTPKKLSAKKKSPKKTNSNYHLHAVNYPKNTFTYQQAHSHYLKDFNEKIDHHSSMPHFWRFTTIYTKEWLKKNG